MDKKNISQKDFKLPGDLEFFLVNSLKARIIQKLDVLLNDEGKMNARKLFLAPVVSLEELRKRVEIYAPEIKTFFYRELFSVLEKMESRFG